MRRQTRNTVSYFVCLLVSAKIRSDAVDSDDLLVERELSISLEIGAAADSPGLDAPMPLVDSFMLRGENPTEGLQYRLLACFGCP